MEKLCANKNHSYKHNEEINKQNIHAATKKKGGSKCVDLILIRMVSHRSNYIKTVFINDRFLFHFIFKEAICRWETTIFSTILHSLSYGTTVSGNEIKLCLKYFCLPIYFVHFEISLTFISPKPSPKPSDVQLLSTRHVTKVQLL
jgi:hypothetical protein